MTYILSVGTPWRVEGTYVCNIVDNEGDAIVKGVGSFYAKIIVQAVNSYEQFRWIGDHVLGLNDDYYHIPEYIKEMIQKVNSEDKK